jgi:hypothetical protein
LYETNHSAYVPVIICNRKQCHYNDRRICEMMTLNEIHYNFATSTFLLVVCLVLKSLIRKTCSCVSNQLGDYTPWEGECGMLLHRKESWRLQSQNNHVCDIVKLSVCHWSQYWVIYLDMKQICQILWWPLFKVHRDISSGHKC